MKKTLEELHFDNEGFASLVNWIQTNESIYTYSPIISEMSYEEAVAKALLRVSLQVAEKVENHLDFNICYDMENKRGWFEYSVQGWLHAAQSQEKDSQG